MLHRDSAAGWPRSTVETLPNPHVYTISQPIYTASNSLVRRVPPREIASHRSTPWPRDWILFVFVLALATGSCLAVAVQFYIAHLQFLNAIGQPLGVAEQLFARLDGTLLLALTSQFAFPLLATTLGFGLACGSAASRANVEYRLAKFYEELSSNSLRNLRAKLPSSVSGMLAHFAQQLDQVQQGRAAVSAARRALHQTAQLLRRLEERKRFPEFLGMPDEHARYGEIAAQVEAVLEARHFVATLEGVDTAPVVGETYTVSLHFSPAPNLSVQNVDPMSQSDTRLKFHLIGEGLIVQERTLAFHMPRTGPSPKVFARVTVSTSAGALRVYVTEEDSAEVLQEFLVSLAVSTQTPTIPSLV